MNDDGHGLPENSTEIHRPYRVGDWLVEPALNRISSARQVRSMEPRAMAVLEVLAGDPGRVVSRQELKDRVWQCEHVAANSLTHVVSELRAVFDDDARQPRYIQTIPKRGYRLIATVESEQSADPGQSPAPKPWPHQISLSLIAGVFASLALIAVFAVLLRQTPEPPIERPSQAIAPPRLVVLPFETIGEGDPDFAKGLCEDVTIRLAGLQGLRVISRTTAVGYQRAGKTIPDIGRDLDVEYVLEGSVQWRRTKGGEATIRIAPQLIRVSDDEHVWADQYDHESDDFFAIQKDLSSQVARHLGVTLLGEEAERLEFEPAAGMAAFQQYLLARSYLMSDNGISLRQSVAACQKAIEDAPGFARAWALKAQAHSQVVHFDCQEDCQEHAAAARDALERCRVLAPETVEYWQAWGAVSYFVDRDFSQARQAFSEAIELAPNDSASLAGLAYVSRRMGDWRESVETMARAIQLDPLNAGFLWNQGVSLMYLHRHEAADALFDRAIAAAPGLRSPHFRKVENLRLWHGSASVAAAVLDSMPGPRDEQWLWQQHANLRFERRFDEALDLLDSPQFDPETIRHHYARCDDLVAAGRPEQAAVACFATIEFIRNTQGQIPEYRSLAYLALCHANLGHSKLAKEIGQQALARIDPEKNAPVFLRIMEEHALVLLRIGAIDDARLIVDELLAGPSLLTPAVVEHGPSWSVWYEQLELEGVARTQH